MQHQRASKLGRGSRISRFHFLLEKELDKRQLEEYPIRTATSSGADINNFKVYDPACIYFAKFVYENPTMK